MTRRFIVRASLLAATSAISQAALIPTAAHASPATDARPPRTIVRCGETITTSITVANNLTCSGSALIIGASNVTLDLGGHVLRGGGAGTGVAVSSPQFERLTGDTVRNGTISGFTEGLFLEDVQDTVLSSLTLTHNGDSVRPVIATITSVVGLKVLHSRITGNAGRVLEADDELIDSTVSDTLIEGSETRLIETQRPVFDHDVFKNAPLDFFAEGFATITDNRFVNSPINNEGAFRDDVFQGNLFTGADVALNIFNMIHEQVTGNVFTRNRIGIHIVSTLSAFNDSAITGNLFHDNAAAGLLAELTGSGPTSLTVSDNTGIANGRAPAGTTDAGGNAVVGAIHVYAPAGGPTVTGNRTVHNRGYGIWTLPGTVTGAGNISIADQLGCNPVELCSYPHV